jgi:hypothetical protein
MAFVVNYVGDNRGRGEDWLTEITSLALISQSAPAASAVKPYG